MTPFEKGHQLKNYTTIAIGGEAKFLTKVTTIEEMQQAIKLCKHKKLPFMVLGKGSNSLFDDRGFDGVVIINKIAFLEDIGEGKIHVGGGYSFSLLGAQTARKGLGGLEFASGIPASVGGAVFMNAGANGTETCSTLVSVDFVDKHGNLKFIERKDLEFSYRSSSFQQMHGAIVGATFQLTTDSEAREKQLQIITYRKHTQPYTDPSAGCVFRNPDGGHAGALIEKCGLKGLTVGGAKVSIMHGNFIINSGDAKAQDVLTLMKIIQQQIKEKQGISLESEIRQIPFTKS